MKVFLSKVEDLLEEVAVPCRLHPDWDDKEDDLQEDVSCAGVELEEGNLGVGGAEGELEVVLNQSGSVSFSMLACTRRW